MTTQDKLERIRNRMTKYELIAQKQDGPLVLAGYCSHGKPSILSMLRKHGEEWTKRISTTDLITFARDGRSVTLGPYTILFSGRTQRQAIIEGELPLFLEVTP